MGSGCGTAFESAQSRSSSSAGRLRRSHRCCLHFLGRDAAVIDGAWHFFGVGMSALAAAFAALLLTVAGARRGDGRTVLVGTAFAVMAALLGLHGLATPGFLVDQNGVVAFTGAATLPVGGAILALSALPSLRRPRRLKPLIVLEVVLMVGDRWRSASSALRVALVRPRRCRSPAAPPRDRALAAGSPSTCSSGCARSAPSRSLAVSATWSSQSASPGSVPRSRPR